MTDDTKQDGAPEDWCAFKAMRSVVHLLLRVLRHHPGTVIDQGRRKYIVDNHGAWRRLGRDA